jgi:hypothetical protein
MSTRSYDAANVTLSFMGAVIDSGFADGEFCTVEQDAADFEKVVGTDGEVTRYPTHNRAAKITVKLLQSSQGNAKLSAINLIDVTVGNGAGIGPMIIRDRGGSSIYTAAHCWISKSPDVKFDRAPTPREWMLECADLVRVDGGN